MIEDKENDLRIKMICDKLTNDIKQNTKLYFRNELKRIHNDEYIDNVKRLKIND